MVFSIPENIDNYILEAPSKAAANFFYLTIYAAEKNEKAKPPIPLQQSGGFRVEDWYIVQGLKSKLKLQQTVRRLDFIDEVNAIYLKSSTEHIKVFEVKMQPNGINTFDYYRGALSYKYTDEFYELLQKGFQERTTSGTIKGNWIKEGEELKKFLDVSINTKYLYLKLNKSRKTRKAKAKINLDINTFFYTLGLDLQKAPSDIVRDILNKICVMLRQSKAEYGLMITIQNGRAFIAETDKIYTTDKKKENLVTISGIDKRTYSSEQRKKQYNDEYIQCGTDEQEFLFDN